MCEFISNAADTCAALSPHIFTAFGLQFHINASYPRVWNMPQTWQCELEVYKATYHFIFAQKNFFTGNFLINVNAVRFSTMNLFVFSEFCLCSTSGFDDAVQTFFHTFWAKNVKGKI